MTSPRSAPGPTEGFRLRSVAVPAYGPTVFTAVAAGAVLPVTALRARELGAGVGLAATVVALLGVGQLLGALPAGALVARVGERSALMLASGVDAVALAVAGLARSLLALAVTVLVSGAASAVFFLARQGFLIDAVPAPVRARALSTLGGTHRIGLFLGPLVGAFAVARWGTSGAYAVAVAAAVAALLVVTTMPDLSASARLPRPGMAQPSVLSVLSRHRRVLLTLGTGVMVISAVRGARVSLLPLWAEHVGIDAATTSLVFAVAGAVDMLLFYPAGWVMDRFGRVWVAVPSVLVLGAGMALLPVTSTVASLTAVAVLMALGNGIGSGLVMTLGADAAPTVGRAQFLGGWRLCGDVGATLGPLLVSGVAALGSLAAAGLVMAATAVAGAGWLGRWVVRMDQARRGELDAVSLGSAPDE